MSRKVPALVVLVLLVAVPSAFAQKVNVDWDHGVDFTKYKTYTWLESKDRAPNDLTHKRILEAIDQQMAAKGFRKVEANPDLFLVYHAGVQEQVSVQGYSYGYGPWRWGGGSVSLNKVVEHEATMVLDFVDAQKNQLVFRGIATDTVSDNPEKNTKKLYKAVEKLFKKYPPQSK